MSKKCIFDKNKICNDCGECYKCELNSNKICNNCGKCMEKEGFDLKEIKIDEVLDMPEYEDEYEDLEENLFKDERYIDLTQLTEEFKDNEKGSEPIEWEYIEEHEDIKEILNDENKFNKMANEIFPGLIKISRKK